MTSCISLICSIRKMSPEVVAKFQYIDWEMCFSHGMVYRIMSLHMCYNYFVHVELHLESIQIEFISFCSVFYIFWYINKYQVPKVFSKTRILHLSEYRGFPICRNGHVKISPETIQSSQKIKYFSPKHYSASL